MQVGIAIKFKNSPRFQKPFPQVYEEGIEYARVADALGFDYIVVPEHHSSEMGYDPTPFLVLTALARETKRIGLSTQPLLLPLYNPVGVAEQLAVLDVLSNGRARLGVGVGYRWTDFLSLGVPHNERGARMNEALAILLGALRERAFSYEGKFYRVSDVDIAPRPLQQPHPTIYVTATSPKAVDRAVRFGLPINTLFNRAIRGGIYDYYCQEVIASGQDPNLVDVSVTRNGFIAPDPEAALRRAKPYLESHLVYQAKMSAEGSDDQTGTRPRVADHRPAAEGREHLIGAGGATMSEEFGLLVGGPETWLATLQDDLEALTGPVPVGAYTFGLWPEGMPLADALTALEIFARQVRPWLAGTAVAGRRALEGG